MPVTTPLALEEPLALDELLLAVVLALLAPLVELRLLVDELAPPPLLLLVGVGVGLGVGVTVKERRLVAVPSEVVTVIGPLLARAGTIAVTTVSLSTLKNAARPLKLTALAPPRSVPVNVTVVPTGPLLGAKLVSVGVDVGVGDGDGDAVSSVVIARSVTNMMSALPAPPAATALTVVIALRPAAVLSLVSDELPLEPLDELPTPLSEIVIASWALASVKSACTVSAMVPLAAVAVR
jgi:hypothetical protein